MLAIAWQYLTGRSVASHPTDRQAAEWPPHPDRVFQALVAAWGEGGCGSAGRAALDWLSAQGAPAVAAPPQRAFAADDDATEAVAIPGAVVKTYVPVNDVEGPKRGAYGDTHLGLLPAHRTRKERFFPATAIGDAVCALVWPQADPGAHAAALAALCAQVTCLGHSSSLVRMWLTDQPPAAGWHPDDRRGALRLRVADPGRLTALERAYAGGGTDWQRPPVARWQGYAEAPSAGEPQGVFDHRLVVLRLDGGGRFTLVQTAILVQALRGLLIRTADADPLAKRLISGHEADGAALQTPHVAYLPLAAVGDPAGGPGGQFADGHLLGLGLALPRDLDGDSEQRVLDAVAAALATGGGAILTLGRAGTVGICADDAALPRQALRSETWCRPSTWWGTVTPIALDRLPPRRHADHDGWAAAQIATACERQGLPAPLAIEALPVSPFIGAPTARAMPPLVRKDGVRRWHLHARLRFPVPLRGPLLLGAGRYQGHGFCRPLMDTSA